MAVRTSKLTPRNSAINRAPHRKTAEIHLTLSRKRVPSPFGVSVATTNFTRRHPRISSPRGTILAWRSGSMRQVSRVANLSMGGFCVRTSEPPPAGTLIQLLLEAPTGQIRARAMVQWSEPQAGMGVKLVAMEQEDHARLANWLKRLSP